MTKFKRDEKVYYIIFTNLYDRKTSFAELSDFDFRIENFLSRTVYMSYIKDIFMRNGDIQNYLIGTSIIEEKDIFKTKEEAYREVCRRLREETLTNFFNELNKYERK